MGCSLLKQQKLTNGKRAGGVNDTNFSPQNLRRDGSVFQKQKMGAPGYASGKTPGNCERRGCAEVAEKKKHGRYAEKMRPLGRNRRYPLVPWAKVKVTPLKGQRHRRLRLNFRFKVDPG
jgi:hypothetical protein